MFFRMLILSQFFTHSIFAQTCTDYSNLVVFGDSLSDVGNACSSKTSSPNMFCPLYAHKKFSDGKLWIEHLAQHIYLPMIASSSGGYNYAFGGATAASDTDAPSLQTQVLNYLKRVKHADEDTLYVLWIGGNDFKNTLSIEKDDLKNILTKLYFLNENYEPFYEDIIKSLEFSVSHLYENGARHFLIPNLPPLHHAPILKHLLYFDILLLFQDLPFVFATFIETYNLELKRRLKLLSLKYPDIQIFHPDIYKVFDECINNLEAYELTHEKELFCFDQFHPSALGHKIIASKIADLYF